MDVKRGQKTQKVFFSNVVSSGWSLGLNFGSGLDIVSQMSSFVKFVVLSLCVCRCALHTVHVSFHAGAQGTAGTAGLQLGRVFQAHDQTAAQIINTSQDRSHHRASMLTSAPLGALKTLPAPLHGSSTVGGRETGRLLKAAWTHWLSHSYLRLWISNIRTLMTNFLLEIAAIVAAYTGSSLYKTIQSCIIFRC